MSIETLKVILVAGGSFIAVLLLVLFAMIVGEQMEKQNKEK